MIPVETISSATLSSLLYYVALVGGLLVIATLVRLKVPFLQRAFIPASLIAGLIGLFLGPHVFKFIPSDMMTSISRLPSQMITVVFACMLLGNQKKKLNKALVHDVVSSLGWTWGASFIQFAVPCLLCAFFFTPVLGVNPLFGALFEVGFAGGHGTASGMASMFSDPELFNWSDGADLAMTIATIGLLLGIFGGIIIINFAVRKKFTKVLMEPASTGNAREVFPEAERKPAAYMTISQDVVDPFAFHLGVIGIAILIGRAIVWGFGEVFHYTGLPLFPFAMIGGWIINSIVQRTSLKDLLDREIFQRIQGMALEILIVAAMASLNVSAIFSYWFPLLVGSVAVFAATLLWMFWVCPHIFKECWFEIAITQYGVKTGVAAVGYMLLRTCDPKVETEAGSIYALSTPFSSPFIGGGLLTTAIPFLLRNMGPLKLGVLFSVGTIIIFLILRLFFWDKDARPEQR